MQFTGTLKSFDEDRDKHEIVVTTLFEDDRSVMPQARNVVRI